MTSYQNAVPSRTWANSKRVEGENRILNTSRVYNKWPIAKEGLPFILIGIALTAILTYLSLLLISIFAVILTAFVVFFFRDPERPGTTEKKAVLTPADGKILAIERLEGDRSPLGEPAVKVSIFMSIFNVHVNRIPVGGMIQKIVYRPGKFFAANLDKASEYNESNAIMLQTKEDRKIVFIQIAGLIARRIACWIEEGQGVDTGQRFGLIRFGSRLEVCLPAESRIVVYVNQKVKAGETIIGYLS